MNVKSKENKENSTIELVVEVSAAEFDAAINKVYNKQKKNISIPGFRKGKAPRKIVESMYGAEVFYEDAVEEAYPAAYSEALKQEGIEPVAYPKLEIVEIGKDGFTFKALVTIKPEVKLGEYKGLTAPKEEVSISEEDIDGEMKTYEDRATRLVSVDREAKNGDTAVIDFEGFKDGVAFEGGKAENYSLELGSGSFVPGFEEQVIGMKAGEEKDIDLTFPEDYAPDLAGAAVTFKVKLHEVKEHQKPVLDDEFAKDVSEFETLADLRKDLGEKLKTRREAQAKRDFENAVTEQLIENMEVEIPEAMVEYQADKMLEDYSMRIQSQGIKFEDYLSMMGLSINDMRQQAMEGARKQVQTDLALEAVVAAEKLEITEEECDAEIARLANEYDMETEQVKAAVPMDDLKHDLLLKKASELVINSAKVGEAPKKTTKKAAKKADAEGEEKKPAKKAAKKSVKTEEKTAKKNETEDAEKKPAKKAAKKKVEETEV